MNEKINAEINRGFAIYKEKQDLKLERNFKVKKGLLKMCSNCHTDFNPSKRDGDFCCIACNAEYVNDMETITKGGN